MTRVRAIVMCAGSGTRWGNHLGVPKFLIPIEGQRLLERTIILLRKNGVDDIWATANKPMNLTAVSTLVVGPSELELDRFSNGCPLWDVEGDIVYLYGDVFYSARAMKLIVHTAGDFRAFGRARPSAITGKRHGEIFAIRFSDKELARRALVAVREAFLAGRVARAIGWEWYREVEGISLRRHAIGARFVTVDDWTEDFDCPPDYERWMKRRRARGHRG